eukprot:1026156-Alexandrium_andersonii.AAC.1
MAARVRWHGVTVSGACSGQVCVSRRSGWGSTARWVSPTSARGCTCLSTCSGGCPPRTVRGR